MAIHHHEHATEIQEEIIDILAFDVGVGGSVVERANPVVAPESVELMYVLVNIVFMKPSYGRL
jgi:uncharacterized membrane protein